MFFAFLQHLTEGARIQSQLQSSLVQLSKTKEKYEKAFGASERALDLYQKADADLNLSRAEVEKQRINSTIKSQQCDDCKNEYANQLQKTNEIQVSSKPGQIGVAICFDAQKQIFFRFLKLKLQNGHLILFQLIIETNNSLKRILEIN